MAKTKRNISKKRGSKKSIKKALPSKISKPAVAARYLSKLCDELETASAGLFHISERDCPYEFFTLQRQSLYKAGDKLTALEFLNGFGVTVVLVDEFKLPVDQLIEVRAFDDFFPTISDIAEFYGKDESDPKVTAEAKRYTLLKVLLKKRLADLNVFRVGKIEIRCYIAGFARHGNIAGLVTTSIET
jgi:hypothetical protein